MPKPNIFPAIRYQDGPAAIEFLVNAFGFQKGMVVPNPDGTIAHAELTLGTGMIMVGSVSKPSPDNPWTAVAQGIYVNVGDVDVHHARAKAAGTDIATPLKDTDYGSREYSARDLEGKVWGFGTYSPAGEGRPDITPGLWYENGPAALEWLEKAFGFEKTLEIPGPNGTVAHSEMRLGDGHIMLGSAPRDPKKNPWGDETHSVNVAMAGVDAHYARAKSAGVRMVLEIADTSYGSRAYTALDLDGHLWTFGTYRPQ